MISDTLQASKKMHVSYLSWPHNLSPNRRLIARPRHTYAEKIVLWMFVEPMLLADARLLPEALCVIPCI